MSIHSPGAQVAVRESRRGRGRPSDDRGAAGGRAQVQQPARRRSRTASGCSRGRCRWPGRWSGRAASTVVDADDRAQRAAGDLADGRARPPSPPAEAAATGRRTVGVVELPGPVHPNLGPADGQAGRRGGRGRALRPALTASPSAACAGSEMTAPTAVAAATPAMSPSGSEEPAASDVVRLRALRLCLHRSTSVRWVIVVARATADVAARHADGQVGGRRRSRSRLKNRNDEAMRRNRE